MQDPFDDGLKALNNLGVTEHLALETAAADGACTGQDIAVDVAAADRASGTKAAGHLTASHAVSCIDAAGDVGAVDAVPGIDAAGDVAAVDAVPRRALPHTSTGMVGQ